MALTKTEVRYLVDTYYLIQEHRKRVDNQIRELGDEHHDFLDWVSGQVHDLEKAIAKELTGYAKHDPMGEWAMKIKGIGPIITAGLLAHIDIKQAPTAGHIWRYAGLDPTCKWLPKEKRPWNASLKTLCWKIGESFLKVSGKDDAYYAQVYLARKALEQQKNERLEYKEQAAEKAKHVGKNTEAYKYYSIGKLPPGHIHARAKRYAVKLFLAHWFEEAYRQRYGKEPPLPYPIAHMGHVHKK